MKSFQSYWNSIHRASKEVLGNRTYFTIFFAVTIAFAALFVYYPVYTTPGNTLEFHFAITPWWVFALIGLLSVLMGLMTSMQVYVFKNEKVVSIKSAGTATVGGVAGFMASVFASASCAACVGALFSFLGAGSIFFLVEHQLEIMVLSLVMVLVSVVLIAQRVERGCEACEAVPWIKK